MKTKDLTFGSIIIDGDVYTKDVIIDRGKVRKREKAESKKYRGKFGHTPLSVYENIPWNCKRLIIGTGQDSALPVMDEVFDLAAEKGVEVITMNTPEAVTHINEPDTNFILHLTC